MTYRYMLSLFILALSIPAFAGGKRKCRDFTCTEYSKLKMAEMPSFRFQQPVELPKPMVSKDEQGFFVRDKMIGDFLLCTTPTVKNFLLQGGKYSEINTQDKKVLNSINEHIGKIYTEERVNPESRFGREREFEKGLNEYHQTMIQPAKKPKTMPQANNTDNNS